jgi:hypothetical protein
MLKAITWCAKCLFLYFLVAVAAIRYSWVFTTPVWQIASQRHWTELNRIAYVLSYFLPIFAIAGFVIGLIPFGRLGKALGDLFRSLVPSASQLPPDSDPVPPILFAWAPVTIAFFIRFITWQSRNSTVLNGHRSSGRVVRFFGTLRAQPTGMLDQRWVSDRFLFTGPMLFLMACALAVVLRHWFTRVRLTPAPTPDE